MKKILSLFMMLIIVVMAFVSCGNDDETTTTLSPGGPISATGISGRDAAMLLLAGERLNKDYLSNDGDVFGVSSGVMRDLSEKALENLAYTVPRDSYKITYSTLNSGKKYPVLSLADTKTSIDAPGKAQPTGSFGEEKKDIGKMEIVGDDVVFSEFEEVSNSYEYFLNLTNNIVISAEIAADMIDFVKKNIRVVGKWVELGQTKYYLSVSENEELMCSYDSVNNVLDICRRYKNGDGVDVYELYRDVNGYKTRMTYIPGQRYELTMGAEKQYFVADNSKGYWITYVLGDMDSHYNISYLILKDDICFSFGLDAETGESHAIQILSSDRETDIMIVSENGFSDRYFISLCAFDGIKNITAPKSDVEFGPDGTYANCSGSNNIVINSTSNEVVSVGVQDENIIVHGINMICYAYGYAPEIDIEITGGDGNRIDILFDFLSEKGITCRRSIDDVKNGIRRGIIDRESIKKYYTWHGENVSRKDGIARAITKELARFDEMYGYYTAQKDVEVISYEDTEAMELNASFASISAIDVGTSALNGNKITVDSLSLTVNETALIVKNEDYKVMIALENEKGGLVHPEQISVSANQYSGEGSFTASATDISLELPILDFGKYKVVAYIATSDGIRSSKCAYVSFDSVSGLPVISEKTELTASKKDGALVITYTERVDIEASLTSDIKLSFEDFDKKVRQYVFNYGYCDGNEIEIKDGEVYSPLSEEITEIADGEYRIAYSVVNGDSVKNGYVYISYKCLAQ